MEKSMAKEYLLQKRAHTKEILKVTRLMDFAYSKEILEKDMKGNGKIV